MNYNVAILTISDRSFAGERVDLSGPALVEEIKKLDWHVREYAVVPDDFDKIATKLLSWCDEAQMDLVLTTGGTGFSPRDITPEATKSVIDREAPGLAEAMRAESMKITPHAMLSRLVTGIRKTTLVINLPGSPKAAVENFSVIQPVLSHALDLLKDFSNSEGGHNFDAKEGD